MADSPPLSLAGTPAAKPLGYYSWTLGQCARDPLYIMVIIYIFFPYFSNVVVGDPVRGQTLIGYLNASAGAFMALTIPFMGAIADKIGRRKPWIVGSHATLAAVAVLLWWILPGGNRPRGRHRLRLLLVLLIAFGYAEVFHNAMLPSVTPSDKADCRVRARVLRRQHVRHPAAGLRAVRLRPAGHAAVVVPAAGAALRHRPRVHEHDRIVGPSAASGSFWRRCRS